MYYQNREITHHPETGFICLTDLWKACGRPPHLTPSDWLVQGNTQQLVTQLSQEQAQSLPLTHTLKTGENLATYATPEVALVYTYCLDGDCYHWATETWNASQRGVEIYETLAAKTQQQASQKIKRRSLIAAGWAVPVITVISLSQQAQAQVSGTTTTSGPSTTTTSGSGTTTTSAPGSTTPEETTPEETTPEETTPEETTPEETTPEETTPLPP